jgi:hypothetical protein
MEPLLHVTYRVSIAAGAFSQETLMRPFASFTTSIRIGISLVKPAGEAAWHSSGILIAPLA